MIIAKITFCGVFHFAPALSYQNCMYYCTRHDSRHRYVQSRASLLSAPGVGERTYGGIIKRQKNKFAGRDCRCNCTISTTLFIRVFLRPTSLSRSFSLPCAAFFIVSSVIVIQFFPVYVSPRFSFQLVTLLSVKSHGCRACAGIYFTFRAIFFNFVIFLKIIFNYLTFSFFIIFHVLL